MTITKDSVLGLLKKWFCFAGRATRRDYWMTVLWQAVCAFALILIIAGIGAVFKDWAAFLLNIPFVIALLSLIVAGYANLFRRFHDLGLSGFWIWYLTPLGLFFIYAAYVMDADKSASIGVDRIKNVGSPWLSWILAYFLWPIASMFGTLLVLFSIGQKQDNVYGPNPYVTE